MKHNCMFCNEPLVGKNERAEEHVLRKAWIRALGHDSALLPQTISRRNKVVGTRIPRALTFVAAPVCKICNNGWMNKLDIAIDALLLALARGERVVESLTEDERFALSRWLVKTACVLDRTKPRHMWHVPRSILARVHKPDFIPKGFIGFCVAAGPVKRLNTAIMDSWIYMGHEPTKFRSMPPRQRLKAAFQYDQVIIGCAWINSTGWPAFSVINELHHVFFQRQAGWRVYSPEEELPAIVAEAESFSRGELLNFALASIGTYPMDRG